MDETVCSAAEREIQRTANLAREPGDGNARVVKDEMVEHREASDRVHRLRAPLLLRQSEEDVDIKRVVVFNEELIDRGDDIVWGLEGEGLIRVKIDPSLCQCVKDQGLPEITEGKVVPKPSLLREVVFIHEPPSLLGAWEPRDTGDRVVDHVVPRGAWLK